MCIRDRCYGEHPVSYQGEIRVFGECHANGSTDAYTCGHDNCSASSIGIEAEGRSALHMPISRLWLYIHAAV